MYACIDMRRLILIDTGRRQKMEEDNQPLMVLMEQYIAYPVSVLSMEILFESLPI